MADPGPSSKMAFPVKVSQGISMPLLDILDSSLPKDIFFCIDSDSFHLQGGPSLYLTLINSFPDLQHEDWLCQLNNALYRGALSKNAKYSRGGAKVHGNNKSFFRWLMAKSDYGAHEVHTPRSQMRQFESVGNIDRFSPYQREPVSVSEHPVADSGNTPSSTVAACHAASRRPSTRNQGRRTIDTTSVASAVGAATTPSTTAPPQHMPRRVSHSTKGSGSKRRKVSDLKKGSTPTRRVMIVPASTIRTARCMGVTKAYIMQSNLLIDREKQATGFDHLCGEGLYQAATIVSNGLFEGFPEYKNNVAVVGLIQTNGKRQFVVETLIGGDHAIFAAECTRQVTRLRHVGNHALCTSCEARKPTLYRKFRAAVDRQSKPFHEKTRNDLLMLSPLHLQQKLASDKLAKEELRKKLRLASRPKLYMMAKPQSKKMPNKGIVIPDDPLAGMMFDNPEMNANQEKEIQEKGVDEDDISEMVLAESLNL